MPRKRSLHVVAHEAGHAAIAIALGVPVTRVSLTPGRRDYAGYCDVDVSPTRRLDWALIDAGGPAADVLAGLYGDRWLTRVPHSWTYDWRSMRRVGFHPRECRLLVTLAASMLRTSVRDLHDRITAALIERDLGESDLAQLTAGERLADAE